MLSVRGASPPSQRPWGSPSDRPAARRPGERPTAVFRLDQTYGAEVHGRVAWVQIDIDQAAEDVDHRISPEERFHIAVAKQ